MKKTIATRLLHGVMWLCEVLGHPGGCWLLDIRPSQWLIRQAYHT